MPNFDKTGPMGKGTQTGRGMGNCNTENSIKEETKEAFGLGRGGQPRGLGRGNGHGCGRGKGRGPRKDV